MSQPPAPDPLTEAALRARRGDQVAAGAFVQLSQAEVWRLCAHLGARGLADDLTQETYARAFASLHRFAGRSSARTWLLSIARRVCADSIRAAVRDRRAKHSPPELVPDPAEAIALRALLDQLDPGRRDAFVVTQVLGLSYAEAADICGCPIGTIRSRVARARTDLLAALGHPIQRHPIERKAN